MGVWQLTHLNSTTFSQQNNEMAISCLSSFLLRVRDRFDTTPRSVTLIKGQYVPLRARTEAMRRLAIAASPDTHFPLLAIPILVVLRPSSIVYPLRSELKPPPRAWRCNCRAQASAVQPRTQASELRPSPSKVAMTRRELDNCLTVARLATKLA